MSLKNYVDNINEKPCIVEFQAFIGNNNEYLIKELVFLDIATGMTYYFLFEAPFPFKTLTHKAKKTNKWLTNYYHFINWDEGLTTFKNIDKIMYHFSTKFNTFYTNGYEKRNWIQTYTTDNVYNIPVDKEYKNNYVGVCVCVNNETHSNSHCALRNAHRLADVLQTPSILVVEK